MRRFRQRLDHLEPSAMLERRHASPRRRHFGWIDLGHDDARLRATFNDDLAPGIDH
jgi:hypothetical protein